MEAVGPFNLKEALAFQPEYLAGWPAIIYDRSLADASLLAREQVVKNVRSTLSANVAVGQEKRNLRTGSGSWSGMTFKHILLPVWTSTYRYAGQEFRLLVNGQSGKVSGSKPKDRVKVMMGAMIALLAIALLALVAWLFLVRG
jgi:hypothetical protein